MRKTEINADNQMQNKEKKTFLIGEQSEDWRVTNGQFA
jgi:hypothetical protein